MLWIALIVLAVMIPEILSTVLDSRLGRALAARVEDRRLGASEDVVVDRVRYLEAEVDRLSGEIQRLHEEGEFVQRLLTERAEAPRGVSAGTERRTPGGPTD
jgi:hypothetical protein